MATILIAAAIAAAASGLPSPAPSHRPDADPAIWVVNDSDTVIYLFGTFHALDGETEWFNDEVETAFSRSDELVLETIVPEAPAVPELGDSGPAMHGLRNLSVAPSASFLASTRMAISAGRTKGMRVDQGADMILRHAAESAGKPVGGLESFEYQIGMFARMPDSAPKPAAPAQDPGAVEGLAHVMSEMQSSWNRGEQGIFAAMLDRMQANSPASYKVMFTDRNRNWANWIAGRLQHPGTVFVAVGAGHLAGRDSLQAKLAERGVRSARIN